MRDLRFFSPRGEIDPSPGGDGRIWVIYNVVDTTNATPLLYNTTGIGDMMKVDDVSVPRASSYLFSTTGQHTVKFKYTKGSALRQTFHVDNIVAIYFPADVTTDTYVGRAPVRAATLPRLVYTKGPIVGFPITGGSTTAGVNAEIEVNGLTDWGGSVTTGTWIKSLIVRGTYTWIPNSAIQGSQNINVNDYRYIELDSPLLSGIGTFNFRFLTQLEYLIVRVDTPPSLGSNAWASFNANAKIYVPYSVDHSILAAYQVADNWSIRASQMYELNPDGTVPTT